MSPANSVTTFLNVDLLARSSGGLEKLLEFLEPSMLVLNNNGQEAALELGKDYKSLEETLFNFIGVIRSLAPEGKILWDRCDFRRLDIGIQGGREPHEASFSISNETLSSLASIQCEITFTVYASP
jgi:hypothetical protein